MASFLFTNIVQELEEQIRTGELVEGTKLPSERVMAEKYGVSRNVIREAFKVMSEKGLVNILIGKGAYVSVPKAEKISEKLQDAISVSKSNLNDILEVREVLERAIAKKAIQGATKKNISRLEELYNSMIKYYNNPIKFGEEDMKFHIEIANCTGNEMFVLLINTLYKVSGERLSELNTVYPERVIKAQREHKMIIEAIKDRDENKILMAIKAHINCIASELRFLEK